MQICIHRISPIFLVFCLFCLPLFPEEKKPISLQEDQMLCGINSLYFAENLLFETKSDYLSLTKQFPDVIRSGVSLAQLHEYLEKKHLYCCFKKMKLKEFSALNPRVVGFVLKERKPISHIYLVTPITKGQIQIYDHPSPLRNVSPSADEEPVFIMIVSRFSKDLPFEWSNILRIASIGSALFGGVLLFVGIRRWRKERVKTKEIPFVKKT